MGLVKISELPAATTFTGAEIYPFVQSGNTKKGAGGGAVFNVKTYGAVGNGIADDTAAIQTCIDAAITDGAIATVRIGLGTIFFPAGTYRITSPLLVQSVLGITIKGEGDASVIYVDADMATALDLNGVALSHFSDFRISGSAGSVANAGLWLRLGAGIGRTTVQNSFTNITIRNLEYIRGFHIGEDGATNQVDTDIWINCHTVGGGMADATLYQSGFHIGTGVTSNNLLHTFIGCGSQHNKRNLHIAASQVTWVGGIIQAAEVDLYIATAQYVRIMGVRSEGSERLLSTAGAGGFAAHVTLSNIDFAADNLHADNNIITWAYGGHLSVSQLNIPAVGGTAPKVLGQNAGAPYTIHLDACTSTTAIGSFATAHTGSKLMITNYDQIDATGASIAVTAFVTNGPLYLSTDTGDATIGLKQVDGFSVASMGAFVANSDGAGGGIQFHDDGGAHITRRAGVSRPIAFDNWSFVSMPRATFYEFADLLELKSNNLRLMDTPGNHMIEIQASKLGFFGATPITKPAANPDTSGATLGDLETEVNQLKALLRSLGLLTA